MTDAATFTHRKATPADLPALRALMDASIRTFVGAYLDEARVIASFEFMGVDTQLIDDGTYFVVEWDGRVAGCGGWSRRATMYGGDHTVGRDARLLDPATEPARVRAMYTHPDFGRRGVGRHVLALCETAAVHEGFRELELMATVAGEPLYSACGFEVIERVEVPTSTGLTVPCARMVKHLTGATSEGQASALWRRLEVPGHDCCRLLRGSGGWRLEGTAVFLQEGVGSSLSYSVEVDAAWTTTQGAVTGFIGNTSVDVRVQRTSEGVWTLNGESVPDLHHCLDLDLGFTPATNLLQLRRIALAVGQSADVPVAWLDMPDARLGALEQHYARRAANTYWYESPRFNYAAELDVTSVGFARHYPGLWVFESDEGP